MKNQGSGNIEFIIPEWALCAIVNDDYTGLTEEETGKINKFLESLFKAYGNNNLFDRLDSTEDELGFCRSNDIDNLGTNCYRMYLKPSTTL